MVKLGKGSCEDKHGGKETSKKRPEYNLRSKDPKAEGSMSPPTYNLRNKSQKTESQNASKVNRKQKTPKKNASKDPSPNTQRRVNPETAGKVPIFPIVDSGTTKPVTTTMNQPSSSQLEPFFHDPIYHIRWEGYELGSEPCGKICVLCNKDLSSPESESDGESEYNEDLIYDDDEDGVDYAYFDDRTPPILPMVDILPCGHAFHTLCLENGAHDEESGDPICVSCSRMA